MKTAKAAPGLREEGTSVGKVRWKRSSCGVKVPGCGTLTQGWMQLLNKG